MKNKAFWKLFAAQTVSAFGDCFGLFALQWYVFTTTGSLVIMGTLAMTAGITELLVRFAGAPLIDRLNRLRFMAQLDFVRFSATGATVVLCALGTAPLWMLFTMAIINAIASALFQPASMAVLPSYIPKQSLVRGYSLMDSTQYAAVILGPALAGVVISTLGAATAMAIDAFSFAFSAICILLVPAQTSTRLVSVPSSGMYYRELWDGLAFFKKAPALLGIMCCVALKNMCSVAVGGMMIPFALQNLHANASQIGLLSSAMAAGLCLGSILVSFVNHLKRRRIPMLGSIFAQGLLYMMLSGTHSFSLAIGFIVMLGACGPFFGTFSSSLYAQLVPDEFRGRVMSARLMVGGALQPAGSYMGGALASAYGLPLLFSIAGAIPLFTAVVAYLAPFMKGIDGELEPINVEQKGIGA
ncbi:MFS transporter [Paenibacillus sp. GCM10027628]|uniref:MFS transporter n=1 Tax=Paenibacillus sp. GCM10027628 TaxID=3273413 RepID=UPI003632935C